MENERQNFIKSLRAKINFGHRIYLWEVLLCVKYIIEDGNASFLNQLRYDRLRNYPVIGICNALSKTLQTLYVLQVSKNTKSLEIFNISYNAIRDQQRIIYMLANIYNKQYNTLFIPRPGFYWFIRKSNRIEFLDKVIKWYKNFKQYYIYKGHLKISESIINSMKKDWGK